jgi:PAS domain S-box-containing protein
LNAYEVRYLDREGDVIRSLRVSCVDDDHARLLVEPQVGLHPLELWQGERLVGQFASDVVEADPAQLARRLEARATSLRRPFAASGEQRRRYFFHLRGPEGLEADEIGLELPGPEAVREQARWAMAGIAGELILAGHDLLEWSLEVTDSRGRTVIELPFAEALSSGESARRASRELASRSFLELFETSPIGLVILKPDLTIVAANKCYRSMTGTHPDQLLDRNVWDVFPKNPLAPSTTDMKRANRSFRRALAQERPDMLGSLRYDLRDADGVWRERHWRVTSRSFRDQEGRAVGLAIEVADITSAVRDAGARQ